MVAWLVCCVLLVGEVMEPVGELRLYVLSSLAVLLTLGVNLLANRSAGVLVQALGSRIRHERAAVILTPGESGAAPRQDPLTGSAVSDFEREQAETLLLRDLRAHDAEDAVEVVGDIVLYGRVCSACGAKNAPIFCASCKSVQYDNLGVSNLRGVMPPWAWSTAAFFALNRFELFRSIGWALLVAIVAFAVSGIQKDRSDQAERAAQLRSQAESYITRTAEWRSAIEMLEANCGATTTQSPCSDLVKQFENAYYYSSWFGGYVARRLRNDTCAGHRADVLFEAACDLVRGKNDLQSGRTDRLFNSYLDLVHSPTPDPIKRRLTARNLFYSGRVDMCAVSVLIWDRSAATDDMTTGCPTMLLPGWEEEDQLPACGASHDTFGLCWRWP